MSNLPMSVDRFVRALSESVNTIEEVQFNYRKGSLAHQVHNSFRVRLEIS